jgi:hypothetical protein
VKYVGKLINVLENNKILKKYFFFTFKAGYLGPIDTPEFINCNAIRNFQFQYDLPNNLSVLYAIYSDWTTPKARSFNNNNDNAFNNNKYKPDSSRKIAYELIEEMLTKEGKNGRECVLRTICEVSETPLRHNGLVGELLEIIFTPGKYENTIHTDYHDAAKAGKHHIDCVKMYPDCPFGNGILDTFSILHEYKFNDILYSL